MSKKGEGTFSEVLKAVAIKNGKYYAIKRMKSRFDTYVWALMGIVERNLTSGRQNRAGEQFARNSCLAEIIPALEYHQAAGSDLVR